MSKYSEALRYYTVKVGDEDFEEIKEPDEQIVKQALRIADRLERVDVSSSMNVAGLKDITEEPLRFELYEQDCEQIFQAMAQQLIEEEENNDK